MKKVIMWILTVFMVAGAIAFFPSFSSVLMIAFAVVAIPIEKIQDFWFFHDVDGWKKGLLLTALFIVSFVIAPSSNSEKPKEDKPTVKTEEQKPKEENNKSKEGDDIETFEVIPVIDSDFDTSDYMKIDAEVLFEYGAYLGGQKVVTVITVENPGSNMLQAKTSNNDSLFFSVVCYFDNGVPDGFKDGDILTVAGTIKEHTDSFLDNPTASMEHCSVIGHGEIAQELKDGAANQREACEQAKQDYEAEAAAAKKSERDEYIAECKTVEYSDVERNPDKYEGERIKISGSVVQVAEGWFDSVTLRVSAGGNMWYVTYSREEGESRILEGDNITCYGECGGVRSYTTVLGSQVTIPSLKMEYYS